MKMEKRKSPEDRHLKTPTNEEWGQKRNAKVTEE